MRKPVFCICENKDADQLRGNREADQHLCFLYTDSTIPLLPKSEISCLYVSSEAAQPGLCRAWSETPKTGFLMTRLTFTLSAIQQRDSKLCNFKNLARIGYKVIYKTFLMLNSAEHKILTAHD